MSRRRSRNAQGGQAHTRTEGLVQLLICYTRPTITIKMQRLQITDRETRHYRESTN